jgi:hypothetical protein
MTTYTTHADALFDPGAPILGGVALQSRDNLIAVTEGDATAPSIALRAVAMAAGTDTVTTGVSEFTGIAGIDLIMIHSFMSVVVNDNSTGSVIGRYRLSNDGGTSWTAYTDINSAGGTVGGGSPVTFTSVLFNQVSMSGYDTIEFSRTISGSSTGSMLFAFHSITGGP